MGLIPVSLGVYSVMIVSKVSSLLGMSDHVTRFGLGFQGIFYFGQLLKTVEDFTFSFFSLVASPLTAIK